MITDFGCAFAIRNEQRQAIEQSNSNISAVTKMECSKLSEFLLSFKLRSWQLKLKLKENPPLLTDYCSLNTKKNNKKKICLT